MKFNRNSNIFIQENALENVVCEMASILYRPQYVNMFNIEYYIYIFMTVDWSLLVPRIVVCVWHQSIIWTNAEILSTYFSGRLLEIKTISLKKSLWKCHFKILPTILSRSQCVKSLLRYRVQFPTEIAMFMGPTWGPSGSCRSQMGPMMASWTVLSGIPWYPGTCRVVVESRICSYC